MSLTKQFLIKGILKRNMKHEYIAIVTAGTRRAAITKFIFHLNEDSPLFAQHMIDPRTPMHHPKVRTNPVDAQIYYNREEDLEIHIEQLNPHRDITYAKLGEVMM